MIQGRKWGWKAAAAAVLLLPAGAFAQTPGATKDTSAMSREERIKAHREKIERIIQENNKKKEEQAAQVRAAAQAASNPAANAAGAPPVAPGQAVAPGAVVPGAPAPGAAAAPGGVAPPIQPVPPAPPGSAPAPAQANAPTGARSESRSMLFLYPFDSTVQVGETFVTEVAADTKQGVTERVAFTLRYPTDVLNPLAIDHSPLDTIADEEIEFAYDPQKGEIYLAADLAKRTNLSGRPLAKITWEAVAPTPGSQIRFAFPDHEERQTGLFFANSNVLGTTAGSGDGVINSTITIRTPKQVTVVQQVSQNEILISPRELAAPEPAMSFSLQPSKSSVSAGDEFYVDVVLNNPRRDPLDRLSLYLQFNPEEVEVIDNDRGNSIRAGVNVQDGIARDRFGFDFHMVNNVDNAAGVVEYTAGAESQAVKGSGVVGRVHFRAKQDTPRTNIVLVRNDPGYLPTTDVSYLNKSLLVNAPNQLTALDGAAVGITPGNYTSTAAANTATGTQKTRGRGVILTESGLGKNRERM